MRPIGEHAVAQFPPGLANRDRHDDPVEPAFEVIQILPQGGVFQRLSPLFYRDGPQQ